MIDSAIALDQWTPSDEWTFRSTFPVDPRISPALPRNQIVTAKSDRVVASPYLVDFNNGTQLTDQQLARIVGIDESWYNGLGQLTHSLKGDMTVGPSQACIPQPLALSPLTWDDSLAGQAKTQALANARRGMVSVPMLLKEMPSTINMIRDRTRTTLELGANAARRSLRDYYAATSRRGRRRVFDRMANYHLELLFGWMPFISETFALMEAMNTKKGFMIVGRGRARATRTTELNPLIFTGTRAFRAWDVDNRLRINAGVQGYERTNGQLVESRRMRASLSYKYDFSWGANMNKYGLNPVDAMFDSVPVSFLLNFSMNVQDFLVASTPMVAGKFYSGCCTQYSSHTQKSEWHGEFGKVPTFPSGSSGSIGRGKVGWVTDITRVDRKVLTEEPEPEFFLRNIVDLKRVASLASISIQQRHNSLAKLVEELRTLKRP